jgi:hypothetical protein
MALTFNGTSDNVNVGSATILDNLFGASGTGTALLWIYPTSTNAGTWLSKNNGVNLFNNTNTDVQFQIQRGTLGLLTIATQANNATFGINKWCCVAASWNVAGVDGDQHTYHGDLTTTIAESAAYSTQRVGSGTPTDTTANNLLIGGRLSGAIGMNGAVGLCLVWNRQLSLGELKDQQFNPHVTSGCVLYTQLGFNGTSTQPDWSGNGNAGTVTGTTQSAHVPLGSPFGRFAEWLGAFTTATATARRSRLAFLGVS